MSAAQERVKGCAFTLGHGWNLHDTGEGAGSRQGSHPCGMRGGSPPAPPPGGLSLIQGGEAVNDALVALDDPVAAQTNLVCMSCGHIQPVQRDQLPSRCESCRNRFTVRGYLLDDTTDAQELSQEVLDNKAISQTTGGRL
jgi:hypothetical protein